MKLRKGILIHSLFLDRLYCLMSVRNTNVLAEYFNMLDVHNTKTLNDVQFCCFLRYVTDLKKKDIMLIFDMLDWNGVGEIGFEEFYMLICVIVANQEKVEKQFIARHSRPVFDLIDMDGGHTISPAEFKATGFLFNLKGHALRQIFYEFDITGDEQLNYKEFKMFAMACIDMQQQQQQQEAAKTGKKRQKGKKINKKFLKYVKDQVSVITYVIVS
uniref:EF-hand calcium binding domain 9 n=1 Tax=Latimeria chalumnae TaxID=7897 RepID=H3ALX8_LATCH